MVPSWKLYPLATAPVSVAVSVTLCVSLGLPGDALMLALSVIPDALHVMLTLDEGLPTVLPPVLALYIRTRNCSVVAVVDVTTFVRRVCRESRLVQLPVVLTLLWNW